MAFSPSDAISVDSIKRHSDIGLALAFVGVLVVLVIPLPPLLLDVLLTVNISFSLMVMLVTLNATHPLELSTFPTLLLFGTLYRLSLNVASTRIILLKAEAGKVISAFGNFVVGGSLEVGLVVFIILVVIQFLVITKGATRISEVAARFTLDGLPGKQMSIDAELNAGLIGEDEARSKREDVAREAEFHGAMDGASKFVRGDAIAGIIITLVNILGGITIGMLRKHMSIGQAIKTYSILTVGDGLVSQIPSLIIATAAGILVTKSSSKTHLGPDLANQLLAQGRPVAAAAGILFLLAWVPGFPKIPFVGLAIVCGVLYMSLLKDEQKEEETKQQEAARQALGPPSAKESEDEALATLMQVDRLCMDIGYRLIPLADPNQGGNLLERIAGVRRQLAKQVGFIIPSVRVKDDVHLQPDTYSIKIRGQEVAKGQVMVGQFLAMDAGLVREKIDGEETVEPAFGLPALWIDASQKERAEVAGYTVIDPTSVIITHFGEVVQTHAHEIFCREDMQALVENLKAVSPGIVEELVPNLLTLSNVQKVLENLLKERIAVADLGAIFELLADHAPATKDIGMLTELVRQGLSRTICGQYQDHDGKISAVLLDPALEQQIAESVQAGAQNGMASVEPALADKIAQRVSDLLEKSFTTGRSIVLLTSGAVRRYMRAMLERPLPNLAVVSYGELTPTAEVEAVGTVRLADDGQNV